MKRKKIVGISVMAILVIAVIILSYLLIMVTRENELIVQEISKVEVEPQRAKPEVISTNTWDLERVNIVNDTEGTPVPVPKGYVASSIDGEHTIDTGFVIYEGKEAVTEENEYAAQRTRNQYVWVPIYYSDEIYGRDENETVHGKLYQYTENGRTKLNWSILNEAIKITSTSSYNEPYKNLSKTYIPEYLSKELKEYNAEFEDMIASIEKYGGFYIGRYETGDLSTIAKVVRENTDIGSKTWDAMYKKCKELKGTNENVTTSMIWGCLWDATLEWFVDTGSKTYEEVGVNSSSWGNYKYTSGVVSSRIISSTGSSEEWKANNIYDMAGNVRDYTQEAYTGYERVARSGNVGGNPPASSRFYTTKSEKNIGCRAMLYIK